ncbi:MAG: transcriptional regulator, partial [Bacteroidetes bacterium]|nr:transcriptional regulator [Bacteroidota bacterium]
MANRETLEEFYQHKFNWLPDNLKQDIGHFNVFRIEDTLSPGGTPIHYARRDFYKISLIRGRTVYHYADKSIEADGTALMFFNPNVPYTYESLQNERAGYFCIFKESFFTESLRTNINELPMFALG